MAAQENRVDGTVGAGFKPAYITAAPQNSPNSPICVVLQLALFTVGDMLIWRWYASASVGMVRCAVSNVLIDYCVADVV